MKATIFHGLYVVDRGVKLRCKRVQEINDYVGLGFRDEVSRNGGGFDTLRPRCYNPY